MADITALSQGLASALTTIPKLRAQAEILDVVPVPCAVIGLPTGIEYDAVMARGADVFTFSVRVLVARASERSAQRSLAGYASGSGAQSVKAALESDPTLGGVADTCRVVRSRPDYFSYGDLDYIGLTFEVEIYA